jgi:hypothetical protein
LNGCKGVVNECPSCEVNAKDFRDLVYYNDQRDACFKTDEYRLGDKVCHESEAEKAGEQSAAPTSSAKVAEALSRAAGLPLGATGAN